MQTILEFLNGQMNQPELYGSFQASWFQYLSLICVTLGIILSITRMKGLNDHQLNRVLWIFSGLLIGFEIYKQVIFTYQAQGSYQWYAFPFQFCSTPMYVALVASFLKPGKMKHALLSFLGTFGLFAGLAVVIYPATVFVTTTGINIQTMVHHGSMAILGFGLLAHHVDLKWKSLLEAASVFFVLMVVAMTLNQVHNHVIQNGTFNMFFINPWYENGIPVLMIFQPLVPHHVFLLIYLFGFSLVAGIVLGVRLLIGKLNLTKDPLYQRA
jgi:hypothetical protein